MHQIELEMDEILYLEAVLRQAQGAGDPAGLKEGENQAQDILDKLEQIA